MRRSKPVRCLALLLLCIGTAVANAASFDCAKARTKLNRMICADAELSALDSRVWERYAQRIAGVSVAHYAHVRERHLAWRRQRGWYEATVDALKDDYQRHLEWLEHPLLALEGRYEHDDGLAVQVEIDTSRPDHLSVNGAVLTSGLVRHAFSWVAPLPEAPANQVVPQGEVAEARPALRLLDRAVNLQPDFIGTPPGPVQDCRIEIRFEADELRLATAGACGAPITGRYLKRANTSTAWGTQ